MIRNYIVIAIRSLLKRRLFSIVNVLGLAIGMGATFMMLQYVQYEWSYDKFHEDGERIYRVLTNRDISSGSALFATTHPGVATALESDFPEVEVAVRMAPQSVFLDDGSTWSCINERGDQITFHETGVYNVDPGFFKLFSFPLFRGDPEMVLSDPSSVVISESIALKNFGNDDPWGKSMLLNNDRRFTVTGVMGDVPGNSHMNFDILVSYFFAGGQLNGVDWKWPEFYTYVKLAPGTNVQSLEKRFDAFLVKYMGPRMKEMGFVEHLQLQPLFDIHLRSPEMTKERNPHGSSETVYLVLVIAVLILVIAWINYVNLSTSKAVERAGEVGIRKVVGARKQELIVQFLAESIVINGISLIVSVLLVSVAYPSFVRLTGKEMEDSILEAGLLFEPWFWVVLSFIFLFGSFLAGLYPAFVLSSLKISQVLKGKFTGSRLGLTMRRSLVGFQFFISSLLIVATITVFRQVDFMKARELGYAKEQLFVIRAPHIISVDPGGTFRTESFKTELRRDPSVRNVTMSSEIPGKYITAISSIRMPDNGPESIMSMLTYEVDPDFMDTYGMRLIAGRNFKTGEKFLNPFDRGNPVLLTERAVKAIGFDRVEEIVGKEIAFGGGNDFMAVVVGVVSDFHQHSLREGYKPILFMPERGRIGDYFTVRMEMNNPASTIRNLEREFKKAFPGNEFSYFFLDEFFDRQYAADQQFEKVFGLFASLSLVVTCLGLIGLSTFAISQRTREIVIRRVFGATQTSIICLFSLDFLRLVFIASIPALPISIFLVNRWLENFAFRVPQNWLVFAIPTLVLAIMSVATLYVQAAKTSRKNPGIVLKTE